MNAVDRLIVEWSYRCDKGYPDINSAKDWAILDEILNKAGFSLDSLDETFRQFKFSEFVKPGRERRAETIATKIAQGTEFEMYPSGTKKLQFADPSYAEAFASRDINKIKQIGGTGVNKFPFFQDEQGNQYGLDSLAKSPELGGKGAGSGTAVEDTELSDFTAHLEQIVAEEGAPINVIVGNKTYSGITTAASQKGFPKSDFNLINAEGTPVVFISHKKAGGKGASPTDFIRWGGFTALGEDPEVRRFVQSLKKFLEENNLDSLPSSTVFAKEVDSDDLVRKLTYGNDYGSEFGLDNVQIVIQGKVKLESTGDEGTYKLTGDHFYLNGEIPQGDYRPVLAGKYRSDRAMFGIPTLEAIAQPLGVIKQTTHIYMLEGSEFKKIK